MATQSILERFRDLSSLTTTEVSDSLAKDQYIEVAVQTYNEIMGESLTVDLATTSTGTLLKDDAIAFLATSLAYQAVMRTKMFKDTGMLEWQRFYQGGLEILYTIDQTKVMYVESRDIYIVRDPGVTAKPYMNTIYRDNVGASSTTGGT